MSDFEVELSALRAWSRQVGRASTRLGEAHHHATSYVGDADFGKILEDLADGYAALLPQFHTTLSEDTRVMGLHRTALRDCAADYAKADAAAAGRFGDPDITDDGTSFAFVDLTYASLRSPSADVGPLAEVSFGFPFNEANDLLAWVTGFDMRRELTDAIVGDVEAASRQAMAWDDIAALLGEVEANLSGGRAVIGTSWLGDASTASMASMDDWLTALADQAEQMGAMGGHLRELCQDAVETAQIVVDLVKLVCSMLASAITSAYIPGWGQYKAAKSAWEALQLANKARTFIAQFVALIHVVKDYFVILGNTINPAELPPAPVAVA